MPERDHGIPDPSRRFRRMLLTILALLSILATVYAFYRIDEWQVERAIQQEQQTPPGVTAH
jgi:hypothetical protein